MNFQSSCEGSSSFALGKACSPGPRVYAAGAVDWSPALLHSTSGPPSSWKGRPQPRTHTGAVASSIPSPCVFSSLYRISAHVAEEKTAVLQNPGNSSMGLSLEKQQRPQGGKVGDGGGGKGLDLVLQLNIWVCFCEIGSGRWVVYV